MSGEGTTHWEDCWRDPAPKHDACRERLRKPGKKKPSKAADPEKSRAAERAWRAANPEKVRAINRAWRAANIEKIRAADRARKAAKRDEKIRAAERAWRVENREKARAINRAWKAANPEKIRAAERAWRAANREKVLARKQAWRAANPEKVRAGTLAWRAANREKVQASSRVRGARRRAWKLSSEGRFTAADAAFLKKAQPACGCCGIPLREPRLHQPRPDDRHLDHIIPLSRGGSNWPSNLQLLCSRCNVSKLARDTTDYRPAWLRAAMAARTEALQEQTPSKSRANC